MQFVASVAMRVPHIKGGFEMELTDMIIEELQQQAKHHSGLYHEEPTVAYYEGLMSASNQALRKVVSVIEHYKKAGVIE